MKYFLKFLCQFVSFFLVFTIGFLSCVAVIVGGAAFVYCNVSIDKLNDWGIGIDTGNLFDPNADVPVNSLTLQTLLEEILGISGKTGQYSLQDLIERYGLILPEEIAKFLPNEVIMDTAIDTLFSKEGLMIILKNTPLSYIFDMAGSDYISQEVYETMGDVTLYELIFPEGKDYSAFLKGVQLGFFIKGVVYEKDADGNYVVDQQGQYPTLLELLAPIDLGAVLGVIVNGESVPNAVVKCLGHIGIVDLVAQLSSDPVEALGPYYELVENKGIKDLFVLGEDGNYEFSLVPLFKDVYFGMFFPNKVNDALIDGVYYVYYADEENPTILELLAPLNIGAFMDAVFNDGDAVGVLYDTLGSIKFNDLLDTLPFIDDETSNFTKAFDGKTLGDLLYYDASEWDFTPENFFENFYLGHVFGVEGVVGDNGFTVSESDDSHALLQLFAPVSLGNIIAAVFDKEADTIGAVYDEFKDILFLDIIDAVGLTSQLDIIPGLEDALEGMSIGTVLIYLGDGQFETTLPEFVDWLKSLEILDILAHFDIAIGYEPLNVALEGVTVGDLITAPVDTLIGIYNDFAAEINFGDFLSGNPELAALLDFTLYDLVHFEGRELVLGYEDVLENIKLIDLVGAFMTVGDTLVGRIIEGACGEYTLLDLIKTPVDTFLGMYNGAALEINFGDFLSGNPELAALLDFTLYDLVHFEGRELVLGYEDVLESIKLIDLVGAFMTVGDTLVGRVIEGACGEYTLLDLIKAPMDTLYGIYNGAAKVLALADLFEAIGMTAVGTIATITLYDFAAFDENNQFKFDIDGNLKNALIADFFASVGIEEARDFFFDATFGDLFAENGIKKIWNTFALSVSMEEQLSFSEALQTLFADTTLYDFFHFDMENGGKAVFGFIDLLKALEIKEILEAFELLGYVDYDPVIAALEGVTVGDLISEPIDTLIGMYNRFAAALSLADLAQMLDDDLAAILGEATLYDLIHFEGRKLVFGYEDILDKILILDVLGVFTSTDNKIVQAALDGVTLWDIIDETVKTLLGIYNRAAKAVTFSDLLAMAGLEAVGTIANISLYDFVAFDDNDKFKFDIDGTLKNTVIADAFASVGIEKARGIFFDATFGDLFSDNGIQNIWNTFAQTVSIGEVVGKLHEGLGELFDGFTLYDFFHFDEDGKAVFGVVDILLDLSVLDILDAFVEIDNAILQAALVVVTVRDLIDAPLNTLMGMYNRAAQQIEVDALLSLVSEDLGALLEGLTLYDLARFEDGTFVIDALAYLYDIKLADILDAFTDFENAILDAALADVIVRDFVDAPLDTLFGMYNRAAEEVKVGEFLGSLHEGLGKLFEGVTLYDLFCFDEDGNAVLGAKDLIFDLTLAEILDAFTDFENEILDAALADVTVRDLVEDLLGTLYGMYNRAAELVKIDELLANGHEGLGELFKGVTLYELAHFEDDVLTIGAVDILLDLALADILDAFTDFENEILDAAIADITIRDFVRAPLDTLYGMYNRAAELVKVDELLANVHEGLVSSLQV